VVADAPPSAVWPWLLVPIGLVLPALWLTGDMNSALAGFLAIGITVAGFLAFGWRWLPPYLLVAAGVALVLLLAPDSYAAFGLMCLLLAVGLAASARGRITGLLRSGLEQRPASQATAP
jgi:hypothetical protein